MLLLIKSFCCSPFGARVCLERQICLLTEPCSKPVPLPSNMASAPPSYIMAFAPPSYMKSHVEWLDKVMLERLSMSTEETRMVMAIDKEYKFHCQHLRAEEMALTSWSPTCILQRSLLRKRAVSAHSELGCSPTCNFWHCMRNGKRPNSCDVHFFTEETDDCLWPAVIYAPGA